MLQGRRIEGMRTQKPIAGFQERFIQEIRLLDTTINVSGGKFEYTRNGVQVSLLLELPVDIKVHERKVQMQWHAELLLRLVRVHELPGPHRLREAVLQRAVALPNPRSVAPDLVGTTIDGNALGCSRSPGRARVCFRGSTSRRRRPCGAARACCACTPSGPPRGSTAASHTPTRTRTRCSSPCSSTAVAAASGCARGSPTWRCQHTGREQIPR